MNQDRAPDGWPAEMEEVDTSQAVAARPARIETFSSQDQVPEDDEDLRYLTVMRLLDDLFRKKPTILMVSDGFTDHCVNAWAASVADRAYYVYFHDPWGPDRGSFLQKGKNAAGIEAQPVTDHPGHWCTTHLELMRVLDSSIAVDIAVPKPGGETIRDD